jgi:hypothetical protein
MLLRIERGAILVSSIDEWRQILYVIHGR